MGWVSRWRARPGVVVGIWVGPLGEHLCVLLGRDRVFLQIVIGVTLQAERVSRGARGRVNEAYNIVGHDVGLLLGGGSLGALLAQPMFDSGCLWGGEMERPK